MSEIDPLLRILLDNEETPPKKLEESQLEKYVNDILKGGSVLDIIRDRNFNEKRLNKILSDSRELLLRGTNITSLYNYVITINSLTSIDPGNFGKEIILL